MFALDCIAFHRMIMYGLDKKIKIDLPQSIQPCMLWRQQLKYSSSPKKQLCALKAELYVEVLDLKNSLPVKTV